METWGIQISKILLPPVSLQLLSRGHGFLLPGDWKDWKTGKMGIVMDMI